MKKLHYILALFLSSGIFAQEQDVKIDTYTFGEGLNLIAKDGHSLKITSYIQPWFESKIYTEQQNGSLTRFRMRRARVRIDGETGNKKFSYRFQFDLTGNGEFEEQAGQYLMDAVVTYNIKKNWNLAFGQRATYTDNRELLMLSNTLQLVERSRVTSAFAAIREFGFFLDGRIKTGRTSYLKSYFVLTNGDGGNVFNPDFGGVKVGGRLDFLPFGLFTNMGQFRQGDIMRELTPKLVVGGNFSQNYGVSSRRGRQSGAIRYLNDLDEVVLPNFTKFGVDFLFKYKGFSILGEFVKTAAYVPEEISKRIRENGTIATTFPVDDTDNVENYVKGRMMLGEGYNIQMGYIFKSGFSIDARYTHLKADTHSFLNNPTFYSRPNNYTIGVSKYLDRNYGAKIQADFTFVQGVNINDNLGNPIGGNEYLGRIMLTFAL
jgi:hypothetical protein